MSIIFRQIIDLAVFTVNCFQMPWSDISEFKSARQAQRFLAAHAAV